ncbi:hypothetical protein [Sinorhizobium glycinis]|nr:hypothetical protein [Sinorhizobium glycinis]
MTRRSRLVQVLLGSLACSATVSFASPSGRVGPIDESKVRTGLSAQVARLVDEAGVLLRLDPVPLPRAWVVLRRRGERLAGGWYSGSDARDALIRALVELTAKNPKLESRVDAIEICLPHSQESALVRKGGAVLSNVHRGIKGIVLENGEAKVMVCPTAMVAGNRSFDNVEKRFRDEHHISLSDYSDHTVARTFDAYQFLLRLKPEPVIIPMFRGNQLIAQSAVNRSTARRLKDLMAKWLISQVQPDGRMIYRYFPSRGEEAKGNNMIRQFMATVALVRLGKETGDAGIAELARKNLRYNLDHFYELNGEHGLIRYKDVRLGAVSLAALAIVEAPFRKEFESYELALRKTTEYMLRGDGSFQTFYDNRDSTDNQNFYSGETQLLWATLYEQTRDKAIIERIQRAFRYYRAWHLDEKNRNPAFIPWHTQAYVKLLLLEDHPEMREFVFEMNDWLLSMQQNDGDYPDTYGRFYDPKRPKFGPPHASSTGVYLEGLIDAYRLAVEHKEQERMARYRDAIMRGLRSLMQLQFADDVDMFYVSKRERVYGGMRTTEYDNGIRVDNVQHAFMGLQRIVKTFDGEGAW